MLSLVEALAWQSGWARQWTMPVEVGDLLGPGGGWGVEPLQVQFARGCVPLATPDTPGALYRGWRLVAIDGITLDVADTPAIDTAFGGPGAWRGSSAFTQARLVGLAEVGTHAITGAAIRAYADSEQVLTRRPVRRQQMMPG